MNRGEGEKGIRLKNHGSRIGIKKNWNRQGKEGTRECKQASKMPAVDCMGGRKQLSPPNCSTKQKPPHGSSVSWQTLEESEVCKKLPTAPYPQSNNKLHGICEKFNVFTETVITTALSISLFCPAFGDYEFLHAKR